MTHINFDEEVWLVNRLKVHGQVFAGVTTPEIRRERIRQAIESVGPSVVVGRGKNRKPVTYAEAFEHVYGTPLTPVPKASAARRADPPAQIGSDPRGLPE